jgi:hypothetical protein
MTNERVDAGPGVPADSDRDARREASSEGGWKRALVRELRAHPFGYAVLLVFLLAGPIGAALLFPQAPIGVVVFGGLAFGIYAALCAVPQKFM